MATLSLIELLKAERNPVISGVVENVIAYDQLSAALPFSPVPQGFLSYKREKALPTTSTPTSGATITEDNALEYDEVTSYLRRFIVDQAMDNLDARAAGGMPLAKGKAVAAASKSLARKFGTDVINGNANWTVTVNSFGGTGYTAATIVAGPGHDSRNPVGVLRYTHSGTTIKYKAPGDSEFGASVSVASGVKVYSDNTNKWVTVNFTAGSASANGDVVFTISPTSSSTPIDGMLRLLPASQLISSSGTNGDAIALASLDQLIDAVKVMGRKVIVAHPRTRRAIIALLRASGGVTMAELGALFGGDLRYPVSVPMYNGIPILSSDWMMTDRAKGSLSTGTMVFCAALDETNGLSGLFCPNDPEGDNAGGAVVAQGANGLTVLDLGHERDRDAQKVRVRAYWGVRLGSELGLAALDEITN